MNFLADLGTDFFHGGTPEHPVHYFAWENLKGALISVAIGAAVYLLIVRRLLIKNGRYLNRWPTRLDLEELVYRPLLLRLLPAFFGPIAALFGENRLTTRAARFLLRCGGWFAALFGENKLTTAGSKGLLRFGAWFSGLFGENKLSAPAAKGTLRFGAWLSELFGKNRLTDPAARKSLRFGGWAADLLGENRVLTPLSLCFLRVTSVLNRVLCGLTDSVALLPRNLLRRRRRHRQEAGLRDPHADP